MKRLSIILIMMLTTLNVLSQMNNVQEGYYVIKDTINGEEVIIDRKSNDVEALQGLFNYQLNTGRKGFVEAPTFRVDIDKSLFPTATTKQNEVDEIIVTECFEDYTQKIWLHRSDDLNIYPHEVFIPFKETSLIPVQVDSLPTWKKIYQNKWKLERTRDYVNAKTTYKELDIPFQLYIKDSVYLVEPTRIIVRVFANEDFGVMQYVGDQLVVDGSMFTPGAPEIDGVVMRRHTCTFEGLTPNTEYTLKVVAMERDGDGVEEALFTITTPAQ